MKIKYFIILNFLIIGSIILTNKISGQEITNTANVQYPVQELGNCEDKTACRSYCDNPANENACLDFALKNNLMSEEEVSRAKKFLKASDDGPGGCKNKNECEEYCNSISHIDECISFAEKNNLIPQEELEETKKVQSAIKRGVKPPACGNKKQCDVYCDEPEHMEECITFGIEAGFIQGKELEDTQKMLQAVKRGIKPPPCKGKKACDEYCSNPNNMELCMNFAMEAGFMSEEEKVDSQKMLQAIKKGAKPPQCKGKEECDIYCSSEEHFEECFNFAEAAGFMTAEDAKMARKTGGKGPGNCKGKEECEAFCNNPDNQETCFNFAKENGMIPEEELKKMEEGKEQFKKSFEQMPQETLDCLQTEVGADMVEKMKNGNFMPSREIGDKMSGCFKKMDFPQGSPESQKQRPDGQTGPGGCKTPEECQKFCGGNPDACKNFQPSPGVMNPGGQTMPQQAGPGGCKTPEECQKFCENNPDNCKNFQQPPTPQEKPCQGDNCQNQIQYRPPEQMQPCQGDNCQNRPPEREFKPLEQGQIQPSTGIMPQNQQQQPQEFQQQPQQQLMPNENPPPPPPPPSAFFKPESFLGALLYPIAKALYNVR